MRGRERDARLLGGLGAAGLYILAGRAAGKRQMVRKSRNGTREKAREENTFGRGTLNGGRRKE